MSLGTRTVLVAGLGAAPPSPPPARASRRPPKRRAERAPPGVPVLTPEGGLSFDVRDADDGRAHPVQAHARRRRRRARSRVHEGRHRPRGERRAAGLQPHHVAQGRGRRARALRHLRRHGEPRPRVGDLDVAPTCKIGARGRDRHGAPRARRRDAGLDVGGLSRPRRALARLARAHAGPHLRVRRRRRADDRLDGPQRRLRLRPVHPRARRRPLHHERRRRRDDDGRVGPLRRVPAAARSRARRARAPCSCTAASPSTSSTTCARTRPARSSTCTTRASTPRSATSTSRHFDARGDRADKPGFSWDFDAVEVMNGYQDPVRTQRRSRRRRLVLAAQPRATS